MSRQQRLYTLRLAYHIYGVQYFSLDKKLKLNIDVLASHAANTEGLQRLKDFLNELKRIKG